MEIANLLIGVTGLFFTIVGILVGMRIARITMRHDRQLAEESGALRKPEIGFAIFGYKVGEGYPDNEDWFFIHPGGSNDYAVYPVTFTIYNIGDAATDEILISIHVPNHIFWKTKLGEMVTSTYPSLASENIKQSVDEIGNFTLISFAIPPLSPKSSFEIILPFSFLPTLENLSVPVKVENTTLNPHFQLLFHSIISITIHTGNLTPRLFRLNMGAIPASSLVDGIQKFRSLRKEPAKQNIIARLRDMFKSVEFKVTNFVSFDIESMAQDKRRKAFIMKSPNQFYRSSWLNIPSNAVSELTNINSECIIGVIDLEKISPSQRKFRHKEGNLVKEVK
ncbi:MAG: hypothetical protein IT247_05485 [Bacteroidia bacterium]|nr:hypothetical protein [Bacteroidia bacterium]